MKILLFFLFLGVLYGCYVIPKEYGDEIFAQLDSLNSESKPKTSKKEKIQ